VVEAGNLLLTLILNPQPSTINHQPLATRHFKLETKPMYSPLVLHHFEHPQNSGDFAEATATVTLENPACGDVLQLAARIEGDKLVDIRFKAKGCVTAIACASVTTELAKGKSVAEAERITAEQIAAALGGLTRETLHASHLAADALQQLLAASS
jgi:nitrogen fixation protein NifU and related proteins